MMLHIRQIYREELEPLSPLINRKLTPLLHQGGVVYSFQA